MTDASNDPYSDDNKPNSDEHLSEAEAFEKIEELKKEIDADDKNTDDQDEP